MNLNIDFRFFFRNLNFIFFSYIISSAILIVVAVMLYAADIQTNITLTPARKIILIAISILSILLSTKFYRDGLHRIIITDQLPLKLHNYQIANLVKFGILELAFILMLIFFILSKESIALVLAIVLFLYMIISKPTIKKFNKEVNISSNKLVS